MCLLSSRAYVRSVLNIVISFVQTRQLSYDALMSELDINSVGSLQDLIVAAVYQVRASVLTLIET